MNAMLFRSVYQSMLIAAALMVLVGGCGKPEDNLKDHLKEMTKIMDRSMDKPVNGVKKLRKYLHSNLSSMVGDMADALVELDQIKDVDKRVKRAEAMMKKLDAPIKTFMETSQKFAAKAMADPEVQKLLESIGADYMQFMQGLQKGEILPSFSRLLPM